MAPVTRIGYVLVMKHVGIADLKARLSGHLRAVKNGETLVVVDRGTPVARIVPAGDASGGLVIRPPTRDLDSARQLLKGLAKVELPVDSLTLLLEDRAR